MHDGSTEMQPTTPAAGKIRTTIIISSEVKRMLQILAREDRRDASAFLEVTIEQRWQEREKKLALTTPAPEAA
jgi:hypothetical protein